MDIVCAAEYWTSTLWAQRNICRVKKAGWSWCGPIRAPPWEETNESKPMWTRTGRYENYRTEPEAIEYGENFISHREGTGATVSPECDHDHESLCPPQATTAFQPRHAVQVKRVRTSSSRR